jgi:hypothetical protein
MKRFLIKIVGFSIPVICAVIGMDLWISHVLANSESFAMGDAKIWNEIIHKEIDAELLIYGSSRAWVHFAPQFITGNTGISSYNFGVDGLAFDIQNLRHELYLKYNKNVKYIIYSVDINTLGSRNGLYNDGQFLPFLLSESLIRDRTRKYSNFSFFDYNLPLFRYKGRTKELNYFTKHVLGKPLRKQRTNGFAAQDKEWNDDFEKAKKKRKEYIKKIDYSVVKKFDTFLKSAKKDNIKVIMMYAPEHILGQSFVINRPEIIRVFDSLATANNIPFYDYSKGPINEDKKFFYNSLHLNSNGVKEFNKLYIKDLKTNIGSEVE